MRSIVSATAGLTLLAITSAAAVGQWPQFRGPQAGVIADEFGIRNS